MTESHASVPYSGPPRLSDVPRVEREHPLFRRGYNLGYSHRAHEETLSDLKQHGPRALRDDRTAAPPSYGVNAGGLLDRLAPGVRVFCDLISRTEKEFMTEAPCCGRQITIEISQESQTWPAACCRCRILYQVDLIQEEPDGFDDEQRDVAVFLVEQLGIAMTRHRSGKWETKTQPQRRLADIMKTE